MSHVSPFKKVDYAKELGDRIAAAGLLVERTGIDERSVLVDSMDDSLEHGYEARPERLYVVRGGQVLWRCGLGPRHYDPKGLRQFLKGMAV